MRKMTPALTVLSRKFTATIIVASLAAALFLLTGPLQAQEEQKGIENGNYNIKQSIEFGGRITDFTGNQATYDTFVNLHEGPRLLGLTLEMRSLNHSGSLFDSFYFTNSGYGGDPNNLSRLRMSKNKWYNFDANFRRDVNFWDYSLLANPLNSATPILNAPAGFSPIIGASPHLMNTRRRLGDYGLTVLPQSRVRFRLGYSRNIAEGPSFTSTHEGTDAQFFQDWKTTVNNYRFGVDFKFLPRTNISYDQILSYYKGDTGQVDSNLPFLLPDQTTRVDLGLPFNTAVNQPCSTPFLALPVLGTANPACNGYLSYTRWGRARTSAPTEQFSLQSSYFKNVDFSARGSYSAGDMDVTGWNEQYSGRVTRTNIRNQYTSGPVMGRRVAASADLGLTWHVTNQWKVMDSFHFSNFHNPAQWDFSYCNYFATSMAVGARLFSPTTTPITNCTNPANGVAGTPVHTGASQPDQVIGASSLFLKVQEKTNLFEVAFQVSPRLTARLGYRYSGRTELESDFESGTFLFYPDRQNTRALPIPFNVDPITGLTATCPVVNNRADGSCLITPEPEFDSTETQIHEHSVLLGISARPTNQWRISFDTELLSADTAFTRISPRHWQTYRVRTTYKPVNWATVNGSLNIQENRNNVPDISNLQHNRGFGISGIFEPAEKYALEIGYDYNDIYSQILICFVSAAAPSGLSKCPGSTVLLEQMSTYTNKSHYGYFDLMVKPMKRLTARVGANMAGTSGDALLVITPQVPTGPLNSKYYRPFGGIGYQFAKNWTGKAYWGYYGYHEDPTNVLGVLNTQDLNIPRNFRGNMFTLSVLYAF